MTKYEIVLDYLESLADEDYIVVHNAYCNFDKCVEDIIDDINILDDLYSIEDKPILDILDDLELVNPKDAYIQMSRQGWWKSFTYYEDAPTKCTPEEITRFVVERDCAMGLSELADILDNFDIGEQLDWMDEDDLVVITDMGEEPMTVAEWYKELVGVQLKQVCKHEFNNDNGITYLTILSEEEANDLITV